MEHPDFTDEEWISWEPDINPDFRVVHLVKLVVPRPFYE